MKAEVNVGDLVFVFPDDRDIIFPEQSILGTVLKKEKYCDGRPGLRVLVHPNGHIFVLFSAEWGKYQPMVHKFSEITLEEKSKLSDDSTR